MVHLAQGQEEAQRRADHDVLVHREVELPDGDGRRGPRRRLNLRRRRALPCALREFADGLVCSNASLSLTEDPGATAIFGGLRSAIVSF